MFSKYTLIISLVFIACVAAFRNSPLQVGKIASKAMITTTNKMSPMDVIAESSTFLTQFSQLVASETDFGGYAGPAGSLVFIGILILTLSPPLADPDQMQGRYIYIHIIKRDFK